MITSPVFVQLSWVPFEFDFILMSILLAILCANDLCGIMVGSCIRKNLRVDLWFELGHTETKESLLDKSLHIDMLINLYKHIHHECNFKF